MTGGHRSRYLSPSDLQNIEKDEEVAFIVSHLEDVSIGFADPGKFTTRDCHVKEMNEAFINMLEYIEKNSTRPVLKIVQWTYLLLPLCQKLVQRTNESSLQFEVYTRVYGDPGEEGDVEQKIGIGSKFKEPVVVGIKKLALNRKSAVFQMLEFDNDVRLTRLMLLRLGAMEFDAFFHWLGHVKIHHLHMFQSELVGRIGDSITEFLSGVNNLIFREMQIVGGNTPRCNIKYIHTEGISMEFYSSLKFPELEGLRIIIGRDQSFGNSFSKMPKLVSATIELFDWANSLTG